MPRANPLQDALSSMQEMVNHLYWLDGQQDIDEVLGQKMNKLRKAKDALAAQREFIRKSMSAAIYCLETTNPPDTAAVIALLSEVLADVTA